MRITRKSLKKTTPDEGKKKGVPLGKVHQSEKINVPILKQGVISGQHLSFSVMLAQLYGVNAAIIYNILVMEIQMATARNEYSVLGKNWVQLSYRDLTAIVSHSLTEKQVKRAIGILINANLIEKAFHIIDRFNPTSWYSLVEGGNHE